jgi:predicted KAP-like P-loop ATPase
MIKNSRPKFSVGIYGEWGSGKTTLMKVIEHKLKQNNDEVLTVWFNAWRYEREEQFALVSLMKTIAYKMDEQPRYEKAKVVTGYRFHQPILEYAASELVLDCILHLINCKIFL